MANFATHFYFSPRGRTGRRIYWMFGVVPLVLANIALGFLLGHIAVAAHLSVKVFGAGLA
jgi:uncharacterized membrane protein YhaH (DUF805 family)